MQPSFQQWLERKPAGPKPRKPLPKFKPRRREQNAKYLAMLPDLFRRHPVCEVCPKIRAAGFKIRCRGRTDHFHHVRGRAGKLLTDERWMLACCRGEAHPTWIHYTHKADAIRLGLIVQ